MESGRDRSWMQGLLEKSDRDGCRGHDGPQIPADPSAGLPAGWAVQTLPPVLSAYTQEALVGKGSW